MALSRAPKEGTAPIGPDVAMDEVAKQFPTLTEFLSLCRWPDGAKRVSGSVLIVWEDGWWKMWLNDRDGERSAWLSAESLSGLLRIAEDKLSGDRVEWRRSSPQQKRSR